MASELELELLDEEKRFSRRLFDRLRFLRLLLLLSLDSVEEEEVSTFVAGGGGGAGAPIGRGVPIGSIPGGPPTPDCISAPIGGPAMLCPIAPGNMPGGGASVWSNPGGGGGSPGGGGGGGIPPPAGGGIIV